jgi:uncharacterized membrane protein
MGCVSLFVAAVLLLLIPLLLLNIATTALAKLGLPPGWALLVLLGIIVGSGINIPVHRIVRSQAVPMHPFAILGFYGLGPRWSSRRSVQITTIAVNVGGCVIPTLLALYELGIIIRAEMFQPAILVTGVVVAVCYLAARPISGVGIVLPGLLPAFAAAGLALLFAREMAAPVAYVAGVLGTLIGADLLHLREATRIPSGLLSVGGAGTFDGILLSGIFAALLA